MGYGEKEIREIKQNEFCEIEREGACCSDRVLISRLIDKAEGVRRGDRSLQRRVVHTVIWCAC